MTANRKNTKRATLRDVARLSGVSTATVARVLHGNGQVSEARRRRVEQAVRDTGYQINAVAQGLRKQRTLVIGHVLNSIATNPFFATVAMGVEEGAATHQCGVLTAFANVNEDIEHTAVNVLVQRRVDAIVFTTANHESSIHLAQKSGIPVVLVERAGLPDVHTVTVDNYNGSRDAVKHLLDLGHTRFAYFGVMPDNAEASEYQHRRHQVERERLNGVRDALADHGLHLEDQFVTLADEYEDFEFARRMIREWILPEPKITAIVAGTDALAAAMLQELYRHKLRVPDDISLVGFDNTYAAFLTPILTTVSQPMFELGRTSADLAISLANSSRESSTVIRHRLTTTLITGESTGPVRRQ